MGDKYIVAQPKSRRAAIAKRTMAMPDITYQRLEPAMERALRLRVAKLQRERDAKAAAVEWCWELSQQLTLEVMDDSRQLREFRQLLHTCGAYLSALVRPHKNALWISMRYPNGRDASRGAMARFPQDVD